MDLFENLNLSSKFDIIKDSNERIIWAGKPLFVPFMLTGIPLLIIGLIWFAIDMGFISMFFNTPKTAKPAGFGFFFVPFMLLHLFPFWLSLANMLRLILTFYNTYYGFSDKRIIFRSGFWGTDFKTLEYDKIINMEVNVNPIENMYGAGSIKFFHGIVVGSQAALPVMNFTGIPMPYEVFSKIKKIMVDVKTDWSYPNKLRPDSNPGYDTSTDEQK